MSQSKCMFCSSPTYGNGCPYSGHGYHIHPNNGKRCIYCGSTQRGRGCPFNPHGQVHVFGVDYNQMISDSVESTIITSYLMERLHKPFTEHKAYELGLIDERGNKIKDPETSAEIHSLSLLDEYLINIKQILGNKVDMINYALFIEHQSELTMENYSEQIEKETSLKKKLDICLEDLKMIINESFQQGLQTKNIEKVILESINDINKL